MKRIALFAMLAILPFTASVAGSQPSCNAAGSQAELNACSAGDFAKADQELNKVWEAILAKYADQPLFLQKLKASQQLWIKFRDAEVEATYPVGKSESPAVQYGSVYPMCVGQAKARLTQQRTEQLKAWLDGVQEGDVCAGSVKNSAELK
ncbi:lysozyme inhibitor LprI family protein [Dyella subtropica]|uniref:lysozyme inhibitor LprI family protein n=1 Tax=Dyella subtropica TaxID=2992127 RepID=UPI002255F643|nr:lysozyme inhibitor LprI family protein [Dyella subtropica]